MFAGAAAFWQWVTKFAGGDAAWVGDVTGKNLPPKLERKELFDQYSRHTKHCPTCMEVSNLTYAMRSNGCTACLHA